MRKRWRDRTFDAFKHEYIALDGPFSFKESVWKTVNDKIVWQPLIL